MSFANKMMLCDSFYRVMKLAAMTRVSRLSEYAYAALALFALTQGPVMRVWKPSEGLLGSLPNPSIPHVHFATYLAVQLPALALWMRRVKADWWLQRSNQALLAFVGWLGLSVLWSTFARHSFPEFIALIMTMVFGLYLAASFTVREFWSIVVAAMGLGVVSSWFAVMRLWDGAVNFQEDYWIGIYYNRNSLAPVTAAAIIGVLGFVFSFWQPSRKWFTREHLVVFLVGAVVLVMSVIELWQSESQTSPAALVLTAFLCVVWLVVRQAINRNPAFESVSTRSVSVSIVVTAIVVYFLLRLEIVSGGIDTQTTSFNQRSGLWALSWDGVLDKPWHGWGWLAAWRTPLFLLSKEEPTWMALGFEWSHSGYMDLLLGGGFIAAILFVGYIWFASETPKTESLLLTLPRVALGGFVLIAATQESFFIGSHFLWALMVAAFALPQLRPHLVEEQDSD